MPKKVTLKNGRKTLKGECVNCKGNDSLDSFLKLSK